ncbi:hypothetical protein [Catenulispora subtropica]|uniref:Uncharacterized protein n=1 Tax=Catenulispora subtropica TaxID=450798 RepID=A0ABN2SAG0_9ACTN
MTDAIRDLEELMAPLDPASRSRVSDEQLLRDAPSAHAFLRDAVAVPSTGVKGLKVGPGWSRKRVLTWAMPGLAVAVAGGTVAAAALRDHKPATVPNTVRCFSVDHVTQENRQYTDTAPAAQPGLAPQDQSAAVAAAVDACSGLWKIGLLVPGHADNTAALAHQETNDFPVPHLVACVLDSGQAAVFPSADGQLCRSLGLSQLSDRKPAGG